MMRHLGTTVWTIAALALVVGTAEAQQQKGQRGGGFGPGGGLYILMAPNVQKDLKLSDEQTGKVQEALKTVREKHTDDMAALRDLPQDERPKRQRELSKTMSDEVKKELALTAEQSKRLDQIHLQQQGLQAFADPAIQDKLDLTAEQKQKLGQNTGGDRAEMVKKFGEIRKESSEKAVALLSADQKKTWNEMTGEPSEIQLPRRGAN